MGEIQAKIKVLELRKAAMYVRMSTSLQQYSIENQILRIQEYADINGIEIVSTYIDSGKSGLSIEGRDGLKKLISDTHSGTAQYSMILVLDVSRWGRFQDIDESAHYEYICRRAGMDIQYVAEPFTNNKDTISTLIKSMKRVMAGEYSRELSARVFNAQCTQARKGFKQGGIAGYGLSRMLIDKEGNHKFLLKNGERKSLNTDKIIIVPGSNEEIEIVRWIFEMYASNKLKESEIVKSLNNRNIKSASNTNWTIRSLRYLLSNEQYIGNIIFNKSSYKLQTKRVINAPNMWIRSEGVIKPIVDKEMFYKAQERLSNRRKIFTNEELIEKLSALYQKHQKLTSRIISKAKDMPCDKVYSVRFGSLMEAYRLVGFDGYYNYSRAKYVLNHVKFKESIKNQVKTFEQLSFNF